MKTLYAISTLLLIIFNVDPISAQLPQLIGTTIRGGSNNLGIIYKMNLDGSNFTPVYSFEKSTGYNPFGGKLISAGNNILYGLNDNGGAFESGCLFSFDPVKNIYKDIIDFNGANGAAPVANLVLANNGLLYGTTTSGGRDNKGTIFRFDPASNASTLLLDFTNPSAGQSPICTMIQASDGRLYGTTASGGAYDNGVIFSLSLSNNTYTKLYDFNKNVNPAFNQPIGGLVQTSDGLIYGLSGVADPQNGVVYNFNPITRIVTVSHQFGNNYCINGDFQPKLVLDLLGTKLYGVTEGCCDPQQHQKIFYINRTDQSYHEVFSFTGTDGSFPQGGLFNRGPNQFYGITENGGSNDSGTVFQYVASAGGGFHKLHDFTGGLGGSSPIGNLTYILCAAKPDKPGNITGNSTSACGKTKVYSIDPVIGATSYLWTVPEGAIIQGLSNGSSLTVLWGSQGGSLSVQALNACGSSAKKTKGITVNCNAEKAGLQSIKTISAEVFPNPTLGEISVKFYSSNSSKYSIHLTDITGRILLTLEANSKAGENITQLNMEKLTRGIYYLELNLGINKKYLKVELQ